MSQTPLPAEEQRQRAKWGLLQLDIEHRIEQVRRLKTYEPRRLMFQAVAGAAAILASGVVVGGLIARLLHG